MSKLILTILLFFGSALFSCTECNEQGNQLFRSKPQKISSIEEINDMLKKYDFYCDSFGGDSGWGNPEGRGFKNDFHLQNDGKVVVDSASGLMWKSTCMFTFTKDPWKMFYGDANDYIETLNDQKFGGYKNWRLPTLDEALSLMEKNDPHIDSLFHFRLWKRTWTSDLTDIKLAAMEIFVENSPSQAWIVDYGNGDIQPMPTTDVFCNALAVRSIEKFPPISFRANNQNNVETGVKYHQKIIDTRIAGGIEYSLIGGDIEQGGPKEVKDMEGRTAYIKPGLLYFNLGISFTNIGADDKTVDITGFVTNLPKKIAENASFSKELFSSFSFSPLTTNDSSFLKLKPGETKKLEFSAIVDPDFENYGVLFLAGDDRSVLLDAFSGKRPGEFWNVRITKVEKNFGSFVTRKTRQITLDALYVEFWVFNNTPYSWEVTVRETINAFQKDGKKMVTPDILIPDSSKTKSKFAKADSTNVLFKLLSSQANIKISPFDSSKVLQLWLGSFEQQGSPILYIAPPIDLAIDLTSYAKINWQVPRKKVLTDWQNWQKSKK